MWLMRSEQNIYLESYGRRVSLVYGCLFSCTEKNVELGQSQPTSWKEINLGLHFNQ